MLIHPTLNMKAKIQWEVTWENEIWVLILDVPAVLAMLPTGKSLFLPFPYLWKAAGKSKCDMHAKSLAQCQACWALSLAFNPMSYTSRLMPLPNHVTATRNPSTLNDSGVSHLEAVLFPRGNMATPGDICWLSQLCECVCVSACAHTCVLLVSTGQRSGMVVNIL